MNESLAAAGRAALAHFPADACCFGAAGVWIDPHREDHEFGRFAWIQDPEGNRVELWEKKD